jgi:quinohemoprotein amine dehydrogenase
LEGRWLLSGHQPGVGGVYGEVTLTAIPGADGEFESQVSYVHGRDGRRLTRSGRVIVYTGFQWRGRTTNPADEDDVWREVMFIDRDGQGASGRWFQGAYDETGMDVTLRRVNPGPMIAGVYPSAVRTAAGEQEVRVYGANLASVSAADIELGPGVTVASVSEVSQDGLTVAFEVADGAPVGVRDLLVGSLVHPRALTVYDKVGSIRVTPESGMARVGGVVFPRQYQQFESWAYHDGPDGTSGTEDDVPLGPVDASWSLEEYAATYTDDDIEFVGTIDGASGLFTPAADGVNPDRNNPDGSNERNNVGDVWVVATYAPEGAAASDEPLRARAHLLVTVPLYMRWEPRPTAQ